MTNVIQESTYPPTFREFDTRTLADHITLRHSVELIGMKRVGISNFLRFFLQNPQVKKNYIPDNHIFISVDLNDLVERELYAFWILTFKRLSDTIQTHPKVKKRIKDEISTLFLASIQSQDLFLATENIRTAVALLSRLDILPTLFLIRFDRMEQASTPEFLANLQSLIDTSEHKLSYVFTSARPLDQLSPTSFPRKTLSGFSHIMYLTPAKKKDIKIILDSLKKRYNLVLSKNTEKTILTLTDGHVQYLHLALIILNENKGKKLTDKNIKDLITTDERIELLSEEIWETLTQSEKISLTSTTKLGSNNKAKYTSYTGIINSKGNFFNPLFKDFVKRIVQEGNQVEFTKKEHLLFTFLHSNAEEICDRDSIIHAVWPEYEEEGVTDWTIDRLISRLRAKLKLQNSTLQIITVKTRGYKLSNS